MNLAELREKVRLRMGIAPNDPLFSTPVVNSAVNDALVTIAEERDWPWLATSATTTLTSQVMTVPSDWTKTMSIRIGRDSYLNPVTLSDFEERYPDSTITGLPHVYVPFGESILVGPAPDSTYTVEHRYYRSEPELEQDTDVPLMPDALSLGVVEAACVLLWRRAGDTDKAEQAQRSYDAWRTRSYDKLRRSRGPLRIKIRRGSMLGGS